MAHCVVAEKLRQNDEDLASVLETRIQVLAEFLKVSPDEATHKTQVSSYTFLAHLSTTCSRGAFRVILCPLSALRRQ